MRLSGLICTPITCHGLQTLSCIIIIIIINGSSQQSDGFGDFSSSFKATAAEIEPIVEKSLIIQIKINKTFAESIRADLIFAWAN